MTTANEGLADDGQAVRRMLTITGLRPRSSADSAEAVHDSVVSMLRLMPGTELVIESGAKAEVRPGMLPSLVVRLDSPDWEMCAELAAVMDDEVSTAYLEVDGRPPAYEWRGRPEGSVLGFRPGSERIGTWTAEAEVSPRDRDRLWWALNQWGHGCVRVRIVAVNDQRFRMAVSVAGSTPLPLGVRAALRDNFPGLSFGPDESENGWFGCEEAEVRMALLLPVGPERPAGFLMSDPAGMPINMTTTLRDSRPEVGGVSLGDAKNDAGDHVDVVLGDRELLRHMHVVGATGTGKSTLLAGMVHQLAHSDNGALVLDPHGTLVDRILAEWPAEAAERLVVVRADDLAHPMPLNPLAAGDPVAVATAIADIGEMFRELFDPRNEGIVGPRFIDRISHALRGLIVLRGSRASLLDVPLMLEHKGMRAALAKRQTDPREALWWRTDLAAQRGSEYGDLASWTNSKFELFSASPALGAILGSGEDAYDPVGAMDSGRVILVDLAKGQTGQWASRLLGYLLLNRFWVAAMNRKTDRRFHVIVDEAHSVMAGSLVNMLSEGRKFGISVTAAHQYLGQLPKDVSEAIAGNVGTSVVFRVNGPHVAEHVTASGGLVDSATLANLPMFHSIVTRNAAADVTFQPFTMTVDPTAPNCVPVDVNEVMWRTHRRLYGLQLHRFDPDAAYGTGAAPAKKAPPRSPNPFGPDAEEPKREEPRKDEPRKEEPKAPSSFLEEWVAKRAAAQAKPQSGD